MAKRKERKIKPVKAKDELVSVEGVVTKVLNGSMFSIKLDNGFEVLGMTSGRMRKFNIRLALGDRVRVEMSPYDLTKGRIVYRCKD